ncbi:MAG: nicotinate-nucleotide adenylyltransferase [Chloroflexota bacterium]|nr:nicotinate-nucleotide adenylyltransferase [Chloroflexota bacterium]
MRIGILGGTFDPIHRGHLTAAEEARRAQRLDRVLFIPANRSPLKPSARASTAQRVAMVQLAIEGNAACALSTVDVERPSPSYAVDTVALLQSRWPNDEFVFLMGADQLADLPQWRAPEKLLEAVPVVALTRPGAASADALQALSPAARARITVQEIPVIDISASAIRERVAAGQTIRGLAPGPVVDYIEEHGLYLPKADGGSE